MCGRFSLAPYEDLSLRYSITGITQPQPRYNIAPGQEVLCILPDSHQMMFWGVRPYGRSLINARMETLKEKAMFSRLLKSNRCLVPATGFYEWDSNKLPHNFRLEESNVFSMAALYTERSEAIVLTKEAVPPVSDIHQRMPCILPIEHERLWLEGDEDEAVQVLKAEVTMVRRPVSRKVNDVKNEGPELLEERGTLDSF